ncbi:MAG: hypothetical protein WC700_14935 [Gemmatimonadaceae bacterium]|jgi:hypothetical protein
MQLKLKVDARKAIENGYALSGTVTIEVTNEDLAALSQGARTVLADGVSRIGDGSVAVDEMGHQEIDDECLRDYRTTTGTWAELAQDLEVVAAANAEANAEAARRKAEAAAAFAAKRQAAVDALLADYAARGACALVDGPAVDWPVSGKLLPRPLPLLIADERVGHLLAEAHAECDRQKAERKANKEADRNAAVLAARIDERKREDTAAEKALEAARKRMARRHAAERAQLTAEARHARIALANERKIEDEAGVK